MREGESKRGGLRAHKINKMETIEFYAYPTGRAENLELLLEMDLQNPLRVQEQDQEQLDKDWIERGYTRSSPIGTLSDVLFNPGTGETRLRYRLTEYKIYSGIAFPALPETEEKLSSPLKDSMRASAIGCIVETIDGKIIVQQRKEGLISGGRLDSGAAGMMIYDDAAGKLDWRQQTQEKLVRELQITVETQLCSLKPKAVFSSRGPAHIPATKGYFTGDYSGMVSSLAHVTTSYDRIVETFDRKQVQGVMGVDKKDLAFFIIDHTGNGRHNLCADSSAALLATLPSKEFYEAVDKINSLERARIRFGQLQEGKFREHYP